MEPGWTEGPKTRGYLLRQITNVYQNRVLLAAVGAFFLGSSPIIAMMVEEDDYEPAVGFILFALAAACVAYAAWQGMYWRDPSNSPVWQEIARYGDPRDVLNIVEDEIAQHGRLDVGSITFTKNWFLRRTGTGLIVCRLEDFNDVRSREHKAKKVGVTLATNYWLRIRTTDGREWEFMVASTKIGDVLDFLAKRLPGLPIAERAHRGLLGQIAQELSGD